MIESAKQKGVNESFEKSVTINDQFMIVGEIILALNNDIVILCHIESLEIVLASRDHKIARKLE